ncbi:MAG: XRE family transcriptional regulator [Candidatus Cloacimonadaceae bacterium]|jgi:SOS-response transcriptional repressor LexA|nr:XRE family transcriptional regulator [Candidatus Cloacimonadota bacterium]MCB5260423.1 XRE family transcriptional regulator [Candidatus Cloacimonadota bacterium]MCK9243539.1 XRE family transcriptional regulator [Candidatus Cloacimonadota bacterium]
MSIGKRIKEIRSKRNINQVSLSRLVGATQAAISRYENDQQYPGGEFLQKLSEALSVNLNWLLTGSGSMFQELQEVDASFLGDTISVPIVGEIAAGEPAEEIYEEPWKVVDLPRGLLSFAPPYMVFRVSGDSMSPFVLPGDLVVCSRDWREVDVCGKIMAFRCEDGITLKKLVEDYKRKVTMLVPLNSHYEPMIYSEGDPDIVMIGILDLCIRRYNRS